MEFLKKNAAYFEKKAREALDEKMYSFTLYFAEQSLQLYIKYILSKKYGDYPKTYSFPILFDILGKINPGAKIF